ncbi:MAG: universal stress protein [Deltaproteobacteria bacterium]|nr:universal stress protein [Deltaproteobacteria bacterium]
MVEIKRILFPVELSDIFDKIVPYVADQADKLGAEVHVIHVVPDMTNFVGLYVSELDFIKTQSELVKEAEARLEELCQKFLPQAKCQVMVGDPVERILEYVASNDISMLVMGTHGRKGIDRIILGSVTLRVLRRSPVPVLTINPFLQGKNRKADKSQD